MVKTVGIVLIAVVLAFIVFLLILFIRSRAELVSPIPDTSKTKVIPLR